MAKVMMNSLSPELTPEEMAEIEAAEKLPVIFDDDCPEMTEDMLREFHRMDMVPVWISSSNMKKVKTFGKDSTKILSHLLDLALNDTELLKKCL